MSETPNTPRAPYRIETARLVLRPYAPEDSETLSETCARCRPHLLAFMPWARFEPQTLDEKLELILGFRSQFDAQSNYVYGIFDRHNEVLLGGTGLHPRLEGGAFEIGYWLAPEAEGHGYVSEAVRALCHVGFDSMHLELIGLRMEPLNVRSEAVAKRLGFVREGLLRSSLRFGTDEPRDGLRYTLLETEFRALAWVEETRQCVRSFDALHRPIAQTPESKPRP